MARKRRPLWFLIGSVYAVGIFAAAAGLSFGARLFGKGC